MEGRVPLSSRETSTTALTEDILDGSSTETLLVELSHEKGAITLMGLCQKQTEDRVICM